MYRENSIQSLALKFIEEKKEEVDAEDDSVEDDKDEEYLEVVEEEVIVEDSVNDYESKIVELETKIEKLTEENESFSVKINEYNVDILAKDELISTLKEFKEDVESRIKEAELEEYKADIDDLIEEFSKDLDGVEEFEIIKSTKYDLSVEDLEKECYVLIGKSKHKSKSKPKKEIKFNKSMVGVASKNINTANGLDEQVIKDKYGEMAEYIINAKTKNKSL